MSNAALNYVFENSKTVGSARVLMLAIADRVNDKTNSAFPSRADLAKRVNVSLKQITELVYECERMGELWVQERIQTMAAVLINHQFPAGPGPQHPWEPPRRIVQRGAHWKHRVKALGNAVVPQVVYPFAVEIMRLLEAD